MSGETDPETASAGMSEREQESFGHYRILTTLGEEGMGTVYLAGQTEPILGRVALN